MNALQSAMFRARMTPQVIVQHSLPAVPAPASKISEASVDEMIQRHIEPLLARIAALELGFVQAQTSQCLGVLQIIEATAKEFQVGASEIKSDGRCGYITHPRQVAMYLCTRLTRESKTAIGLQFGDKDHSTVSRARTKIIATRLANSELNRHIANIERALSA